MRLGKGQEDFPRRHAELLPEEDWKYSDTVSQATDARGSGGEKEGFKRSLGSYWPGGVGQARQGSWLDSEEEQV